MDSLDGIATFVAVVRAGSFSQAAEKLGSAKSTISETVTRLERRVGARLLRRSARGISLTEAGRTYLRLIDDILDRASAAEMAARSESSEARGTLRISAPAPFAARHVAPLLPGFLSRHPDIRIDLQVTSEIVDLVVDGFDLALRLCKNNDPNMIIRRLGASRIIAVAAPEFLRDHGNPVEPAGLEGWPVVATGAYPDRAVWHLERGAERVAVPVRPLMVSTCQETTIALALSGSVAVQVAECNVLAELASGRLLRVPSGWSVVEIEILAVYPDNRQIAAKVRAFVDHLARKLPTKISAADG